MGISAEATETKATALIAECRRCLKLGVPMQGQFIKDVLAQLESATVNDLSGRTNVAVNNAVDGRNAEEILVIT